ncbi:MAG: ABC transporter permease subunit [Phycisphaerales bacterium]
MPAALRWLLNLGPTNPIVVRIVQGGSRRTRHMYIRTGYLAVLIAVLLWSLLLQAGSGTLSYRDLAAVGASSFESVAYLQIALICLLAPVFMAGAIAQEANPRTWEVMLTTPLSPPQIVLGNLLGRLFFVLALLFSSLPLFAITQYFGGVPGRSILLSYLIAACAALLVGSIAVFLSVGRIAGRRAVFAFYIAVVTYLGATIAIDLALRPVSPAGPGGVTVLTPLNPFLALRALLSPSEYPRPDALTLGAMPWIARAWFGSPVAVWCWLSAGLSTTLCIVSSVITRKVVGVERAGLLRKLLRRGAGERNRAPRSVWNNSIAWREAASRAGTTINLAVRYAFAAVGLLWGLGVIAAYHGGMLGHDSFRFALLATVWTELAVITLVAVNMSATAVSREREDGSLDILLTTPITPKAYLWGKLRGLISFLIPLLAVPMGTLAIAALYVLVGGLGREDGVLTSDRLLTTTVSAPVLLPESALLAPLLVLPFMAFVVMIGLQWSIKSKGTIGSVIFAFGVIAAVTGVVGLCGWQASDSVAYLGPAMAALNPATLLYALANPVSSAIETVNAGGLFGARLALACGAVLGAVGYAVIVYGLYSSMVRRFDMTVRALAGNK